MSVLRRPGLIRSASGTHAAERAEAAGEAAVCSLFLGGLHQGGIWEYDNTPACIGSVRGRSHIRTHAATRAQGRAIITLLRHTRRSSGKPRGAAERRVNRKLVTQILAATHALRRGKSHKQRVHPHKARGSSVCLSAVAGQDGGGSILDLPDVSNCRSDRCELSPWRSGDARVS